MTNDAAVLKDRSQVPRVEVLRVPRVDALRAQDQRTAATKPTALKTSTERGVAAPVLLAVGASCRQAVDAALERAEHAVEDDRLAARTRAPGSRRRAA